MAFEWEEDDPWTSDGYSDGDAPFDPTRCSPTRAGELLADCLIEMKLAGSLSAKHVCTIAWWAHKAGACGPVDVLKWRPDDASSGHFHRQFDKAAGSSLHTTCEFYSLPLATHSRSSATRVLKDVQVLPMHETLDAAYAEQGLDHLRGLVEAARDEGRLPLSYFTQPAVVDAPADAIVVCTWTVLPS